MKILEISPQPVFQPRGTPFSVYHRTLALSKLGHKIDLVCYHIGQPVNIKNVNVYRSLKIPLIKDVKIGPSIKKIFLDIFIFTRALGLLLRRRYDMIHVHEEAGLMGVLFKWIFGCRLIYDMHSSMPQQITNFKFSKNRLLIKLMSWIERLVINNSDAVIVICPHLGETVKKINPDKKVFLIENTPMAKEIGTVTEKDFIKFEEKYKLEGKTVILYTGTLEHYQGIDLLIKSVKHVIKYNKDILFLMVGGSKQQVNIYKKMTDKFKDNIKFIGQRPIDEMDTFLALAEIVVSPRDSGTNTPLKIYSYLKSGVPIVATDLLTHTQVLNNQVAVLTKPNPRSFADGIIDLLSDKEFKCNISKNAVKLANTKYSYQEFLRKTKRLYDSILDKGDN